MQKRGLLFFVLALLVFSNFSLAQETFEEGADEFDSEFNDAADFEAEEEIDIEESNIAEPAENNDIEQTEETSDLLEEAAEEYSDAELPDGGARPGDALYFADKIFDNFASDEDVAAEKAAEAFAAYDEGDRESAREAFTEYEKYNKELIENADPELRDKIRRNSAAIYRRYNELPENDREEFGGFVDGAREAVTAGELSFKIKELCTELAKLDPAEYARVCSAGEDAPKWQKDLYDDLSAEQEAEVERFADAIEGCFKDPENCDCSSATNIQSFVDQCELISLAEAACREGNDAVCDSADEIGEGIFESLEDAPHLQRALESIERKFSEFEGDRYNDYLPPECQEAGATTPDACRQVMIELHAPEECRDALKNVRSEREARQICEEIMFNLNAPPECIEAGLKDHRECGRYMFQQNAPQECIDAGLDGSSPRDPEKCRKIMDSLAGEFGPPGEFGPGRGPPRGFGPGGFNPGCANIQNAEERLKCYDGALQGAQEHVEDRRSFDERYRETKEGETQCAKSCLAQGGAWDFTGGECECRIDERRDEFGDFRRGEFREGEFREFGPPQGDFRGPPECAGLSPDECRERFSQGPPPGEFREGEQQSPPKRRK